MQRELLDRQRAQEAHERDPGIEDKHRAEAERVRRNRALAVFRRKVADRGRDMPDPLDDLVGERSTLFELGCGMGGEDAD